MRKPVSVLFVSLISCLSSASAQPQGDVIWSFPAPNGIYCTGAIPDVSGDSLPEAVAVIYYGATTPDPRKVYCLSGPTGDTIWVNRTAYGTWGNKNLDCSPDLNHDGYADVLIGTVGGYTGAGRSVIALSGRTGDTLWRYTRGQNWGWVYCVRSFADIDGDSVPDVLGAAGTTSGVPGAGVLVSGRTGAEIWFYRLPSDAAMAIAPFDDINSDSIPDVLLGAGGNSINDTAYCLSGLTGSPIWKRSCLGDFQDIERIPDVNHSGTNDCLGGGWSDSVFCLEGSNGSFIWATDIGSVVMEVVPVRDINGDSIWDVAAGSWNSSVYLLSGADGSIIWTGPIGQDAWPVDTLADVTGDGLPEIVAGAVNGRSVKVFDGATGQALWFYNFNERVYDVTGVPDMNGDGVSDVLVGLQDQGNQVDHLYCFSGLTGPAVSERKDLKPRPQPIRTSTIGKLELVVPLGQHYSLNLFDACGRQVLEPVQGIGTGKSIAIALNSLSSGAYFCRLASGAGSAMMGKVVIP
ncbi:MAG: PQQ-binding-like beta-propeller repeat protein [candidate division WOR-3 bacterium]